MSNETSSYLPVITIPDRTGNNLTYNTYAITSSPLRLQFIAFRYREMTCSPEMAEHANDFYAIAYLPVLVAHPYHPSIHMHSYIAVKCLVHPEENSHHLFERLIGKSGDLPEPYKDKVSVCDYVDFSVYGNPKATLVEPYLAFDHKAPPGYSPSYYDCRNNVRNILVADRTFAPVLFSTLLEPVKIPLYVPGTDHCLTIILNPIVCHGYTPAPPAPLEAISNDEEVTDEN